MYLGRYHDLHLSKASIWRVLKRAGVNRLPSSMRYRRRELRYKRYEKPLPGHQLQVDVLERRHFLTDFDDLCAGCHERGDERRRFSRVLRDPYG